MTFGIGHTDTYTLGHEGLMLLLTKKLLAGLGSGISVGEALVAAKAEFAAQQFPSIDAYAEKALISTAILGIPQTKLQQGTQTQQALQALSTPPAASATPVGTLNVTVLPSSTSASASITLATTPQGKTAHQLDGRSCAIYGRPLLGCLTTALLRAPTPGLPVRSVLLRGGAYTDQTGVAIANADVATEWSDPSSRQMPNSCVPTFVPGQLASVNRLEDGRETVVVTGAQCDCTLPESQRGIV